MEKRKQNSKIKTKTLQRTKYKQGYQKKGKKN